MKKGRDLRFAEYFVVGEKNDRRFYSLGDQTNSGKIDKRKNCFGEKNGFFVWDKIWKKVGWKFKCWEKKFEKKFWFWKKLFKTRDEERGLCSKK